MLVDVRGPLVVLVAVVYCGMLDRSGASAATSDALFRASKHPGQASAPPT